jgi:hypothetical protein
LNGAALGIQNVFDTCGRWRLLILLAQELLLELLKQSALAESANPSLKVHAELAIRSLIF